MPSARRSGPALLPLLVQRRAKKEAVRHALGSRDRCDDYPRRCRTGKTTLEQEIGEALAEAGKPVSHWRSR